MTKDSRLEKFLKALCSLDYSDLPTPLSRVEVLWNCLITGEATPDFQPQSRTEKYLMSILGVYDLEDIPQPISRAEILLYKLATGDTDVELEDGAKSRYERLLSEIVANGGVGDNVDFEYVSYVLSESFNTLYNTVEKPVKSAILKGQTLYRVNDTEQPQFVSTYTFEVGEYLDITNGEYRTGEETHVYNKDYWVIPTGTKTITLKGNNNYKKVCFYNSNKNFIIGYNHQMTATTDQVVIVPTNAYYFRFNTCMSNAGGITGLDQYLNVYVDDYLYATNKELTQELVSVKMPVLTTSNEGGTKTNILTVNEEVVLRGIGDVQDTLDLMTGEVVERVGEVIFDGSVDENWNLWATYPEESAIFRLSKENSLKLMKEFDKNGVFKCDKFSTVLQASIINSGNIHPHAISFFGSDGEYIQLRVYKSLLKSIDVDGLREYLANEQITVQYYLATEVVKTVDLSTLDQDGNKTKLKTFDDITYVSLSSEGLIPEAEMTVATKNLDDISQVSTMSLRMNDISNRQIELQNEVDTQSESIDSTMMATTEIYEQTL